MRLEICKVLWPGSQAFVQAVDMVGDRDEVFVAHLGDVTSGEEAGFLAGEVSAQGMDEGSAAVH